MKIRTQNLLFIVPIFLGVAIINGLLSYSRQLAEVKWGMEEEIEALAIVTAEFTDGDVCRKLMDGEVSSEDLEGLRLPLERIMEIDAEKQNMDQKQSDRNRVWIWIWKKLLRQAQGYSTWERLRRLFILAPDGQQVIFKLGRDADEGVYPTFPHVIEAIENNNLRLLRRTPDDKMIGLRQDEIIGVSNLVEAIEHSNVVFTDVHQHLSDDAIMTAYAPIYDGAGALSGILGVEMGAETLGIQKSLIGMKITIISAGIFLLGTLAALFISGVIARKIRELTEAARAVVEGDYNRRVDIETIQEVIDLGNTFNTMSSVLEEVLSRTKRELIDGEQFRTQADLAKAYNETLWKPREETFGDVEVAARLISGRPTGDFFGVFQVASGSIYATLGRVRAEEDLDSVTLASAAFSLIRQGLDKCEPKQVFRNVCELLDVETWQCICWNEGGSEVQWLGHNPDGDLPLQGTMSLQERTPLAFHTLGKVADEKIDSYVKLFGHLRPTELMEDLMVVLAEESEGGLIIIGKC